MSTLEERYALYKQQKAQKANPELKTLERYEAYKASKGIISTPNVQDDPYQKYAKRAQGTFEQANQYTASDNAWQDPQELNKLRQRAIKENLDRYLLTMQGIQEGRDVSDLEALASSYKSINGALEQNAKYYGQFKDQAAYDDYKANELFKGKTLDELLDLIDQERVKKPDIPAAVPSSRVSLDNARQWASSGMVSDVPFSSPSNRQRDMANMGSPDEAAAAMAPEQKPRGWDYDAAKQQDKNRVALEDELMRLYGPKAVKKDLPEITIKPVQPMTAPGPSVAPTSAPIPMPTPAPTVKPDVIKPDEMTPLGQKALQYYWTNYAQGANAQTDFLKTQKDDLQTQRGAVVTDINKQSKYSDPNIATPSGNLKDITLNTAVKDLEILDNETRAAVMAIDEKYAPMYEGGKRPGADIDIKYANERYAAQYKGDWNKLNDLEKTGVWLGDHVKRAGKSLAGQFEAFGRSLADIIGVGDDSWAKFNQEAIGALSANINVQDQSMGAFGDVSKYGGMVFEESLKMIPTMALFLASKGLSATSTLPAIGTAGAGLGANTLAGLKGILQQPNFSTAFMRAYGGFYQEEHDVKGKDVYEASGIALMKAIPNALVEMSSGPETGFAGGVLGSAFGEAGEEIAQLVLENADDYARSGKGLNIGLNDVISWDNPEAIIPGKEMLEAGALGFATSLVAGGAMKGVTNAASGIANQRLQTRMDKNLGSVIKEKGTGNQVLEHALTLPKTSDAYKLATELKGSEMDGKSMGKLGNAVISTYNTMYTEAQTAEEKQQAVTGLDLFQRDLAMQKMTEEQKAAVAAEAVKKAVTASEARYKGLDVAAATEMRENAEKATDKTAYEQGYSMAYELGRLNVSGKITSKSADALTPEEYKAAFTKGKAQGEADLPDRIAKARELRASLPKAGEGSLSYAKGVNKEALKVQQKEQIAFLEPYTKATGHRIEIFQSILKDGKYVMEDGSAAPNGYMTPDGTLHIDVNAGMLDDKQVWQTIIPMTAGHEVYHFLNATVPDMARDYAAFVLDKLAGQDIDALIQSKYDRSRDGNLSMSDALEEVIADASEMALSDTKIAEKIAKTNPSLFAKIKEWLTDFVARVRKAFEGLSPLHSESRALMQQGAKGALEYVEGLVQRFDAMQAASLEDRGTPATVTVNTAEEVREENKAVPAAETKMQERDSDNRALSPQQVEYFRDSKVRNADGKLLTVYHGTPNEFTTFSQKYIGANTGRNDNARGFYFSSAKSGILDSGASWYGDKIIEAYLNIKNPLVLTDTSSIGLLKIAAQISPNSKIDNYELAEILKVYNKVINHKWDVSEGTRANSKDIQVVFDGRTYTYRNLMGDVNKHKDDVARYFTSVILDITIPVRLSEYHMDDKIYDKYDGVINDGEFVVFAPEQIKSIDNLAPTSSSDIRYQERERDFLTQREILANAFESVAQNTAERQMLATYKGRLAAINDDDKALQTVNTRIKELSFAPGPRDTNELAKLRNNKKTLEERISRMDKTLLRMEAATPLKRLVEREGEKAHTQIVEERKGLREDRRQIRQDIEDSDIRTKIRNIYLRLTKALARPTEKQYIPAEYVQPLIDVAEAIDITGRSTRLAETIARLRAQYEVLKNDPDYSLASEFDQGILDEIRALQSEIGDILPINLKDSQLKRLYKVLKAVETTMMNARKLIASGIAKDNYEAAEQLAGEVRAAKGIGVSRLSNFLFKYTSSMLDARRAARLLAGYTQDGMLERLIAHINDGQLKKNEFIMRGSQFFEPLMDNSLLRKFTGRQAEWIGTGVKDPQGRELRITQAMRVPMYMHTLNEDNLHHLLGGGITMPVIDLYKQGRFAEAFSRGNTFQLTKPQVMEIVAGMTEYEKAWAKAAQEFFAFTTEEINKTSMQLVGYKKAMVQNYFPIQSDRNFLRVDFESIARDGSIEGMGFLKERKGSSNPMYLMDITSVLDRQLNNTSKYVGLAIPVRNFNKVYRVSMQGYADSVQKALNQVWGEKATKYLENLMADVQDARKQPPTFFDKAKGHFAQSVLALNPSVSLKQAASYPTAAAVVGWKPLLKAMGRGGKNNAPLSRADQELIAKYTPLLWLRTKGMSTTELGDIRSMTPDFGAVSKLNEVAHKYILNWIQQIDVATVGRLWYAAQYNIDETRPDLEKGSDPYYEEVAKLFNRVVEETQPDYTTMQRPDILRNPNAVVRGMTMFMTQRLQNFGILYDAAGEMTETGRRLKLDPNNTALKAQRERAGKQLTRAVVSQVVSALVLSMMTLMGKALLHRPDEYRDELNQITAGSVAAQIARDVPSILLGMVVGGAEMYETALSLLTGDKSYGLAFSPIEFVNDLYSSTNALLMEVNKTIAEGKDPQKMIDAAIKVTMQSLTFLGLPVNNAKKIADGIFLHYQDLEAGAFGSLEAGKQGIDKKTAYNNFVEAFVAGDQVRMDLITKELTDTGATDKKIQSDTTAAVKAQYVSGDITKAQATKYLSQTQDADKIYWTLKEWDSGLKDFSRYDSYIESVKTGIDQRKLMDEILKHGNDKGDISTAITNAFKKEYIELMKTNRSAAAALKSRLLNAYVMLGYDRAKKSKDIDEWTRTAKK